jgi:hypothetical protein
MQGQGKALVIVALIAIGFFVPCAQAEQACETVRCRIAAVPELAKIYDPGVPLFLTRENARPLIAAIPALASSKKFDEVLQRASDHAARLAADRASHKPLTCAVVGNSQNLLHSHYGPNIDGHDYVFRMNNAPVKSYEGDVGTKTSLHMTRPYLNVADYGPGVFHIAKPWANSDESHELKKAFGMLRGDYAGFKDYYLAFPGVVPANLRTNQGMLLLHPEFLWYATLKWFRPPDQTLADVPSKGFIFVVMAMQMCDKIDVFGFGADQNGLWSHYYPEPGTTAEWHRPDYQDEFLRQLDQYGIIHIYHGT